MSVILNFKIKLKIDEYLAKLQLTRKKVVGCIVHFVHLATTLLKDEDSA